MTDTEIVLACLLLAIWPGLLLRLVLWLEG